MANFNYVVLTKEGRKVEGSKEATSKTEVIDSLINQGVTIISIKEEFALSFKKLLSSDVSGFPIAEKVVIAKQLATMITAGIPIIQAIDILRQQAESESMKELMDGVYKKIESGNSLSSAFRQEKKVFSEVQLSLIEAGEKSGNLNSMLLKVAEDMEKSKQLRGKILGALIYPAIIFVVLIIVVAVMILFMVPQVRELYISLGQEDLPLITEILVSVGTALGNPVVLAFLLITIITIILSYRFYVAKPAGKLVVDRITLKIPVFGNLITKIQLAEFSRLTSMLLNSGIPIIQTVEIVSNALSNSIYSSSLLAAKEDILKGASLSLAIAKNNKYSAFPMILLKMVSVGEEAGKLDKVLEDMYKFYDAEVEQITANLTKLLEPFILVIVGGFVAFLAIAIYLPIYQVGNFV